MLGLDQSPDLQWRCKCAAGSPACGGHCNAGILTCIRKAVAPGVVAAAASHGKPAGKEADPHRIAQRQKQVDLGKNTLGYQRYRQQVPR